jgi:hypothetical protein
VTGVARAGRSARLEGVGEFGVPIADEEAEALGVLVPVHQQVPGLFSATALIPQQKPQVTAQNRVFERDTMSVPTSFHWTRRC